MKKKLNSKSKGSRIEREIAKKLTERFKKDFIRTPMSGAYYTLNPGQLTENLSGDIITPENFKYSIEIKGRKEITFHKVLNGAFDEFIEQCEKDAFSVNKLPLIIVKLNNYPPFCLVKNTKSDLHYKGYNILYLDKLLQKPDKFFFTESS